MSYLVPAQASGHLLSLIIWQLYSRRGEALGSVVGRPG